MSCTRGAPLDPAGGKHPDPKVFGNFCKYIEIYLNFPFLSYKRTWPKYVPMYVRKNLYVRTDEKFPFFH